MSSFVNEAGMDVPPPAEGEVDAIRNTGAQGGFWIRIGRKPRKDPVTRKDVPNTKMFWVRDAEALLVHAATATARLKVAAERAGGTWMGDDEVRLLRAAARTANRKANRTPAATG
jgi:hypothetical protein